MPNSSYSLGRPGGAKARTSELTLPSFKYDEEGNVTSEHNVCRVRIMDPVAMLSAGLLDDFDHLTKLAGAKMQQVDGKTLPSPEAVRELAGLTGELQRGLDLVDRLVEYVVVEPKVLWPVHRYPAGHPEAGKPRKDAGGEWMRLGPDERDDETLYTDDVDLEDRMFIMQWAVGGIKDPEQFRGEYTGLLESVEDEPELPLSAFGSPSPN